jgi:hypothetical protein
LHGAGQAGRVAAIGQAAQSITQGETEVSPRDCKLNEYLDRIVVLQDRPNSGGYDKLTERQRKLFDFCKGRGAEEIPYSDISSEFPSKTGIIDWEIVPTDFCYNLVNMEDKPNKFLCQLRRRVFRFVDFDWSGMTAVTWTPRPRVRNETFPKSKTVKVGVYDKSEFRWDFDAFREEIERLRCG